MEKTNRNNLKQSNTIESNQYIILGTHNKKQTNQHQSNTMKKYNQTQRTQQHAIEKDQTHPKQSNASETTEHTQTQIRRNQTQPDAINKQPKSNGHQTQTKAIKRNPHESKSFKTYWNSIGHPQTQTNTTERNRKKNTITSNRKQ